jgi:hypothetical protein
MVIIGLSACRSVETETVKAPATNAGMNPGTSLPGVVDLTGHSVNPFQMAPARAVLFIFVRTDCPVANRYAPEIERLYRRFAPRDIACWLVYPDADTTPEEIRRHLHDYRLSLKALRDPRHELVKRAGVSVTPEAALFLPEGVEVYHGRIDDRCIEFGKERPEPTQHDLEDALTAVLQGKPIARASTPAVGCYIPELSLHDQAKSEGDNSGHKTGETEPQK